MNFEDFMFLVSMNLLVEDSAFVPYPFKEFVEPGVEALNNGMEQTGIKYFSIEGICNGDRGFYIKQIRDKDC